MKRLYLLPLFIGSLIQGMDENKEKFYCRVTGSLETARIQATSIIHLVNGQIDQAQYVLGLLDTRHTSSPNMQKILICAAALNKKTITEALDMLKTKNISLASLKEKDCKSILQQALDEVRQSGDYESFAILFKNYIENKPDNNNEVFHLIQAISLQLRDIDMLIREIIWQKKNY